VAAAVRIVDDLAMPAVDLQAVVNEAAPRGNSAETTEGLGLAIGLMLDKSTTA